MTVTSSMATIRIELPTHLRCLQLLAPVIAATLDLAGVAAESEERPALAYNLELAVNEVLVNIVKHAHDGDASGRVTLTLEACPTQLSAELVDHGGSGFDPAEVASPDLEVGQVHGYGLFLVQELMDEVYYDAVPGGNRWRLVKRLSPGGPR